MKTLQAVFIAYLLYHVDGAKVTSTSTEASVLQNSDTTDALIHNSTSIENLLQNSVTSDALFDKSTSAKVSIQDNDTTEALVHITTSTEVLLQNSDTAEAVANSNTSTDVLLQNKDSTEALIDNSTSMEASLQVISRISNDFSFKMYDALRKTEGNLFVSPMSLEILLAMIYLGSKGNVSDEIKTALNLPNNDEILKEGFKELINKAENSEPLEIATRMFASVDFKIKEKFLLDAAEFFYSGVENVDYIHKPQEAVKTINTYVAEKTHNKIKDLLNKVSPDTALILVNALYFKADWLHPFPVSRRSLFYIKRNESVTINMMSLPSKDLYYKHDEKLQAQILELPYKDNEYSMLIFLPDDIEGLQNVEEKLVSSNFEDVTSDLFLTTVNLKIPKFRLEKQIELNSVLEELGMTSMFVPDAADLSGIADGNLYVSKAVQKTFINVDEKGTEAAAATGHLRPELRVPVTELPAVRLDQQVMLDFASGVMLLRPLDRTEILFTKYSFSSNEKWFFANHPFIFTIVRKADRSVLFMGRFVNNV